MLNRSGISEGMTQQVNKGETVYIIMTPACKAFLVLH